MTILEKNLRIGIIDHQKIMKRIGVGLRWKVIGLTLSLVTLMIISIGFIVAYQQKKILEKQVYENAKREAQSIVYLDSRAIISQDDLVILDSLKNLNELGGFVYGRVIESQEKINIVELYHQDYSKRSSIFNPIWERVLKLKWEQMSQKTKNKVLYEKILLPGGDGARLLIFHLPLYHPFISVNPPLLGIVQLAFSDSFIKKAIAKNQLSLLVLGIIFWIIGIFASILMAQLIVKPINILSEGAKIVGGGNLDYVVPDLGKDELGQLAKQFNIMTNGLKTAEKAKAESLILDEQLKQAQEIQEGMNPNYFLKGDYYQAKGFTRAAKGVGGDYFDFHKLENGKFATLISDVSGKSISASLVMVIIKTVVSTFFKIFKEVRSDIITKTINQVMCGEAHIDKFATFFFVIFDPNTGELEFTNGGHGPLFLYRFKKKICTLTKLAGLPMGIDADNDYSIAKVNLEKGDMIVFFTDGINEARDPDKAEYGNVRLGKKIIELADKTAEEIVDHLVVDLDNFMQDAEQHDDMTLVVVKFT